MTLKLNVSARNLDNKVNYNKFDDQVFPNRVAEEVIKEELATVKKIRGLRMFGSVLGATLIPIKVSAETVEQNITGDTITPETMFQFGLTVGFIGLGISFAIAIGMFTYTGILKMMKQREKSKEWTTDVIKGFVHCLVAIPTIFALYYLSTSVFGGLLEQLGGLNETFLNIP